MTWISAQAAADRLQRDRSAINRYWAQGLITCRRVNGKLEVDDRSLKGFKYPKVGPPFKK